jgi:peroxiredoxin (alkyl hydroperoxide reductase subunit C)
MTHHDTTTEKRGMLTVGDKFPNFKLQACVTADKSYNENFKEIALDDSKGKWRVIFFWPLDFTFVCPTEIVDFDKHYNDFKDRGAIVLGASCDSEHVHLAWRNNHADLKNIQVPMLADYNKTLSAELGILAKGVGAPLRATFIVDPDNIIRYVDVCDLKVGRNTKEFVRVLDALQTDELCPSCWEKGKDTLKVA